MLCFGSAPSKPGTDSRPCSVCLVITKVEVKLRTDAGWTKLSSTTIIPLPRDGVLALLRSVSGKSLHCVFVILTLRCVTLSSGPECKY